MRASKALRTSSSLVFALTWGCGNSSDPSGFDAGAGSDARQDAGSAEIPDGSSPSFPTTEAGPPAPSGDPKTCAEAAASRSYVGCDYWPTVVANNVWSVFDFAVVVANAGELPADVVVTGPNGVNQKASVAPGQLATLYLPWVPSLKGPDWDCSTFPKALGASVFAAKGAYHLVSSVPVSVYQFNALEYQPQGGPPGKDWSRCPNTQCSRQDCLSFSNDASLLIPSTAMTGNYRVAGINGWTNYTPQSGYLSDLEGPYFAITGTQDATTVTVKVGAGGGIMPGDRVQATGPGGLLTLTLDAGDVVELVAGKGHLQDLSGSQVAATKPVQVIAGIPCTYVPRDQGSCDHTEESVFPAETLGKHYAVTAPANPDGAPVGHLVRLYGNVDGTKLTGLPPACGPGTLNAGQVVDCGVVTEDFEVTGDHEFSVSSFQQGSDVADKSNPAASTNPRLLRGDPSQSQMVAVEQFRSKYVFLAPSDYETNYVVVAAPAGAALVLDGQPLQATFTPIGSGNLTVARVKLGPGQNGAHAMSGDKPFGIQIMGYGRQTSFQYPGGLDLHGIAPPPPPPR